MTKYIGILVSPNREEFFEAYGPQTKIRDKATRFHTEKDAERSMSQRFGRLSIGFWNSERESEYKAKEKYRNWTMRVEPVNDDDDRRNGYQIYTYEKDNQDSIKLYAVKDSQNNIVWTENEADCSLWSKREDALKESKDFDIPENRRIAINSY